MKKYIGLILILISLSFHSCDLFNSASPVEAPGVPSSLTGEDASLGLARISRGAQEEYYDEFSNFYVVAQVGENYNLPLEQINSEIQDYANDSSINWTNLAGNALFTQQAVFTDRGFVINANDDFSAWETITITSELRRHMRVVQKDGYVLGTLFMTHAGPNGSNEMLEIIKSDNYTYTKIFRVRNPDGDDLKEYNSNNTSGSVFFDMFAGITMNDELQHSLGIKRYDMTEIEGTAATHDYTPIGGLDAYMVAAFDTNQLMIRPDNLTAPLEIFVDEGLGFTPEFTTWPSSQGESFDASLFPGKSYVDALFDVGASAAYSSKGQINDDFTVSYPTAYIEWIPSDIGLE